MVNAIDFNLDDAMAKMQGLSVIEALSIFVCSVFIATKLAEWIERIQAKEKNRPKE